MCPEIVIHETDKDDLFFFLLYTWWNINRKVRVYIKYFQRKRNEIFKTFWKNNNRRLENVLISIICTVEYFYFLKSSKALFQKLR